MTLTRYESYQNVELIFGPFKAPSGNNIYPALNSIELVFEKDNAKIMTKGRLVNFNSGTYKYTLNTTDLMPGYYSFVATANIGDMSAQIRGHFELSRTDVMGFFIWRLRYKLFDWIASKYHLDFWKEGLKWNDTQLMDSIESVLGDINSWGGRDLGYLLDTLPANLYGVLLNGATYYALLSRAIYEVAEEHNYTDEVTLTINRDYNMAISNYERLYNIQLNGIVKRIRPRPMSLKSAMYFNEFQKYLLSMPVSAGNVFFS